MNPLLEIGKDGQCILWQPHLLTAALATSQSDALLALEPVLNPAGVSGEAAFGGENNETSVRWDWAGWQRVEIRAEQANGLSAPLNYVQPQRPVVGWNELPAASAVELTFYSAEGVAGGCVKIEVPDTATFGRDVEFGQPRGGTIIVRLLNSRDSMGLSVEMLRLGQREGFKLKGSPLAFSPGQSQLSIPVPNDFFGIVAIVKNRHQRRHLIGYARYNGRKPIPPDLRQTRDAKEFQKIRRWIEGDDRSSPQRLHQEVATEEWLDNWPLNSRTRFRYLAEQARLHIGLTEDVAYKALRAHPTGLLRYLALFHCGYTSSSPEKIVRLLNEGSFAASLNTALPNLGSALAYLQTPEEILWAVRQADNPHVAEAATWAGGQGVAALERALHLLDKRSEARAAWKARQAAAQTVST